MSETCTLVQINGSEATETNLASYGNVFDFKNTDTTGISDFGSYPITAGKRSSEIYLRLDFTGTFTEIKNIQVWQSKAFSPATGLQIKFGTSETYSTPTFDINYTDNIPSIDPASPNVGINGDVNNTLTEEGNSDFIILQLQSTTSATPGDTSLAEITFQYEVEL